jgi:hypothetical protein
VFNQSINQSIKVPKSRQYTPNMPKTPKTHYTKQAKNKTIHTKTCQKHDNTHQNMPKTKHYTPKTSQKRENTPKNTTIHTKTHQTTQYTPKHAKKTITPKTRQYTPKHAKNTTIHTKNTPKSLVTYPQVLRWRRGERWCR